MGRQPHRVPESINTGPHTVSFGCVGNRVYTGASDTEAYSRFQARIWRRSRRVLRPSLARINRWKRFTRRAPVSRFLDGGRQLPSWECEPGRWSLDALQTSARVELERLTGRGQLEHFFELVCADRAATSSRARQPLGIFSIDSVANKNILLARRLFLNVLIDKAFNVELSKYDPLSRRVNAENTDVFMLLAFGIALFGAGRRYGWSRKRSMIRGFRCIRIDSPGARLALTRSLPPPDERVESRERLIRRGRLARFARAAGIKAERDGHRHRRSNALSDDAGQRANKHTWQHDGPVVARLAQCRKGAEHESYRDARGQSPSKRFPPSCDEAGGESGQNALECRSNDDRNHHRSGFRVEPRR